MTKRRLYAPLPAALCWLWCCEQTVVAQPKPLDPPCGACIKITIEPGQLLLLPEELGDLTVLVRATGPPAASLNAALGEIRARRGRPGVALAQPTHDGTSIDQLAFDLKQTLTDYRATAGSSAVIALSIAPALKQPLFDRGIEAYTDLFLQVVPAGDLGGAVDMARRGVPGVAVAAPADPLAAQTFLRAAVQAARLLPLGLAPLDRPTATCGASFGDLFLHPETQDHIALVRCRPGDVVRVAGAQQTLERLDLAGGLVILRLAAPPGERFAEGVHVRAGRRLSVEEIVARHQAVARRQSAFVAQVISSGTTTLTFEAPGLPAPMTISSNTVIYGDRDRTELEQRDIRINGIEFQGGRVPRLPILEPERVASIPLAISLTDDYRYRLERDETVHGVPCHVVSFEPLRSGPLFSGRAWIAMDGFGMLKVAAAQTGLRGAIVSSEQVDEFREVQAGVWLLTQSDVRQLYEGPGHRTPIHRRMLLHEHFVNPSDFSARRSAAYASNSVMLRDTPQGYRYLRRDLTHVESGVPAGVQVTKAATRVRTLAGGVIVDPNISVPLPFAGISYIDFDLFGSGAQFNGFFGGAYGQMALSIPSVLKSRWQLAGRAFAIATSYNDRSFRSGREIYDEALRQRPAHASVWALRPLTTRISVRAGYDLDYTRLRAAPETGPGFVVPADQIVHSGRFALEGQRAGWTASVWWNPARRTGWRAWGRGAEYRLEPRHISAVRADGFEIERAVAAFGLQDRGTVDGRPRSGPLQPVLVRDVRQPPARVPVGAGPLRSRRRHSRRVRVVGN